MISGFAFVRLHIGLRVHADDSLEMRGLLDIRSCVFEDPCSHIHWLPIRLDMESEKFAKLTRQCAIMPGRTLCVWMVV